MRTRIGIGSVLAAAAIILVTVAVTQRGGTSSPEVTEVVGADSVLPNSSMVDWVSYADQVAVVHILGESEIPPPVEVWERGEGYIGRTVEARVERDLWVASGRVPLSGNVEIVDWGWHLKDGEKRPFRGRMEVGGLYLVPLVNIDGKLGSMALSAIAIEDGKVSGGVAGADSWYAALAGVELERLGATLADTPPDPLAVQFGHLPPVERAEAVKAARGTP